MIRDIFTNKWTIGAIGILILFAGACYLYYQQTTAHDREHTAQAYKQLQEWKDNKAQKPTIKTDQESTETPAESITQTAEKPINKGNTKVGNNTEPDTQQADVPATNKARVSAFGFGPYPELPADFPYQDLFDPPYYSEDPDDPYKDDPDFELMHRVGVELWKRGENVEGMGTIESTGLFYPTIRGTIYVEWAPRWKVFGKGFGRTIRSIDGHPDDLDRLKNVNRESQIPSDLKVLDISEGIDPYEFLNLPR